MKAFAVLNKNSTVPLTWDMRDKRNAKYRRVIDEQTIFHHMIYFWPIVEQDSQYEEFNPCY